MHIGDGVCDDVFNTPECNFDGQDCCHGSTEFCEECKCKVVFNYTEYQVENHCAFPQYFGDNICDDPNNTPDCHWDGGDCCKPEAERMFCTDCICYIENEVESSNMSCAANASQIGDGFCDDEANNAECNYDQQDCCNTDGLNVADIFCQDCICYKPWDADNCMYLGLI